MSCIYLMIICGCHCVFTHLSYSDFILCWVNINMNIKMKAPFHRQTEMVPRPGIHKHLSPPDLTLKPRQQGRDFSRIGSWTELLGLLSAQALRGHRSLSLHIYICFLAPFIVSDVVLSTDSSFFLQYWLQFHSKLWNITLSDVFQRDKYQITLLEISRVPLLHKICLSCSCSAGAAWLTFNSIVCCSETIGCIQLLSFDTVWRLYGIWSWQQESDLDICSWVCGAIN